MQNFSFLSGSNILVRWGGGGFTVIIMQVSFQIGLNLTGLELSLAKLQTLAVRIMDGFWPRQKIKNNKTAGKRIWNFFELKICLNPKFLGPTILDSKFLDPKFFSRIFFGPKSIKTKIFLNIKFCWTQNFLGPKLDWTQNFLWTQDLLRTINILQTKNIFWVNKILTQILFRPTFFFNPKVFFPKLFLGLQVQLMPGLANPCNVINVYLCHPLTCKSCIVHNAINSKKSTKRKSTI